MKRTPNPLKIIVVGLLCFISAALVFVFPPGNIYGALLWGLAGVFGLLAGIEAFGL